MKNFRKLGTALTLAGFVATGMFASSARLQASGFGSGESHPSICQLLAAAETAAKGVSGYGYYVRLVLDAIHAKQNSLGCS